MHNQFREANRAKMEVPVEKVPEVIKKTKTKVKQVPKRTRIKKEIKTAPQKSVGRGSIRGKSDMGKAQRSRSVEAPRRIPQRSAQKATLAKKKKTLEEYEAEVFRFPQRKK